MKADQDSVLKKTDNIIDVLFLLIYLLALTVCVLTILFFFWVALIFFFPFKWVIIATVLLIIPIGMACDPIAQAVALVLVLPCKGVISLTRYIRKNNEKT